MPETLEMALQRSTDNSLANDNPLFFNLILHAFQALQSIRMIIQGIEAICYS